MISFKNYYLQQIKDVSIIDGKSSYLHIDKSVYAIHLDDVKEVK